MCNNSYAVLGDCRPQEKVHYASSHYDVVIDLERSRLTTKLVLDFSPSAHLLHLPYGCITVTATKKKEMNTARGKVESRKQRNYYFVGE